VCGDELNEWIMLNVGRARRMIANKVLVEEVGLISMAGVEKLGLVIHAKYHTGKMYKELLQHCHC
jgi:hypothetical protein